jgi:hypothetical protein
MTEPESHETPSYNFEGDPAFHERKFVDTTGYIPPWQMADAFTIEARTYADETIEEVEDPNYVAQIVVGGAEPGESEFSWGRGNQNSLTKGPGPNPLEILKAQQRTNPAEPTDNHLNHYTDPGWVMEP